MTTLFGWCFGPEGAIGDHDTCPHEIGAAGSILRCGCPCHEPAIEVNSTHEGGRIEQADEVRQHPIGSDPQSFRFNERG